MTIEEKKDLILGLFHQHGEAAYGEHITQNSHAIQAGLIAQAKGLDEELILAAFLHDIGHLLPATEEQKIRSMGNFGTEAHDRIGEEFLRQLGFRERLLTTIRNHVDAKRYLCFTDAAYYDTLSDASKETLRYQGGPMQMREAKDFEQSPFFSDSIVLRKIDEQAKDTTFTIKSADWDYLATLLLDAKRYQ